MVHTPLCFVKAEIWIRCVIDIIILKPSTCEYTYTYRRIIGVSYNAYTHIFLIPGGKSEQFTK